VALNNDVIHPLVCLSHAHSSTSVRIRAVISGLHGHVASGWNSSKAIASAVSHAPSACYHQTAIVRGHVF